MNKKEQRRQHFALTMLFSLVTFCVIFVSVLIAGVTVYVLVHTGIISGVSQSTLRPGQTLLFMVLASNVVGFCVALLSSRIPLRPVKRIVDQMNELASGNFKVRMEFGPPISKHPTFAELAESFNKMAEELESTELLRSDFINNFSHEFKTPIVSIAGFAKLLKKGNLTEEQKLECLNIIEAESLRLSQMATNVLNLTKVENQSILTDVTSFNLSEQLRTSILLVIDQIEKKNLGLKADFGEYMIEANEELLKQVWINLVHNAVKFSPDGGNVDFSIREADNSVLVSVINTGATISPENQKKIFNKFYQADESHATEGNGIGLAIVKRVVELHRGAVSVHSENGVTMFTVELPKAQT